MFTRLLARQRSRALRPITSSCHPSVPIVLFRHLFHTSPSYRSLSLPELDNIEQLKREGIPNLYSADGFDIAWTLYHSSILNELNFHTQGSSLAGKRPETLIGATARDPTLAYAFNRASMAWNNHFYFSGILTRIPAEGVKDFDKLDPSAEVNLPRFANLRGLLQDAFGSIHALRNEMIETAYAMFGPGFVWLVQNASNEFKIVSTYNAGSPLSSAHWRLQGTDQNTQFSDAQSAGKFGPHSMGTPTISTAARLTPVLCVNTWEHAWMPDFGIMGKRDFLEAWWDRVDWRAVEGRLIKTEQFPDIMSRRSTRYSGISINSQSTFR